MDALFNLFKIKFDKLNELLDEGNDIKEDGVINIYINLEMIWRLFININNENLLKVRDNEKIIDVIANIINLASHYRLYCKKHKLQSRIIMYTPTFEIETYRNSMVTVGYRKSSIYKFGERSRYPVCQSIIRDAINMAKTICEYLDDIYLIESYTLEPSLIPMIVKDKFDNEKDSNFIITNDQYDYQYTNYGFYVFRPDKENSIMIKKGMLLSNIKKAAKINNNITISDTMYTFILALIGDKNRNIDKIPRLGIASVLKLLDSAKDKGIINDDISSIEIMINILKDEMKELAKNNFYSVDLDFQKMSAPESLALKILLQIKNKFDIVSLRKLNDEFFTNHPIQLLEINNDIKKPKSISKRKVF